MSALVCRIIGHARGGHPFTRNGRRLSLCWRCLGEVSRPSLEPDWTLPVLDQRTVDGPYRGAFVRITKGHPAQTAPIPATWAEDRKAFQIWSGEAQR